MILDSLAVDADMFAERTGWESKPEGLCKGVVCVPAAEALLDDGSLSVPAIAERLRMPLISDDARGIHVLGPESGGRALTTAAFPDIELIDVDGNPFQLKSLRGRKVLLVAWGSW